jgi:hypothetical protein
VKLTNENEVKAAKFRDVIGFYTRFVRSSAIALTKLKSLITDTLEYTTERRAQSMLAVKQAIRRAGNIVPASGRDVEWKMSDGEAWFETADGLYLDRVEGSGYRATLSMFMRGVYLRLNPGYLNTLILDEVFAKLSAERSVVLASYLAALGENMQIISIEQKPEVFEDIPCVSYNFLLTDGVTSVRRDG